MSSTLKVLAATAHQVANLPLAGTGWRGMVVAAALSMASAAQAQEGYPGGAHGSGPAASMPDLGRAVQSATEGLRARWGVPPLVETMRRDASRPAAAAAGATATDVALAAQGRPDTAAGGLFRMVRTGAVAATPRQPLPETANTGIRQLLIDAAAAREVAQRRYDRFAGAELEAATNPAKAEGGERLRPLRQDFEVAMDRVRRTLSAYSHAVGVASQQGYEVTAYARAGNELSSQISRQAVMFTNPEVMARAELVESELAKDSQRQVTLQQLDRAAGGSQAMGQSSKGTRFANRANRAN